MNYFCTLELVERLRDLLSICNGSVVLVASHAHVFAAKDDLVEILLSGDIDRILDKVGDMEGLHVFARIKKSVALWMCRNVPAYAADGIRLNTVAPGYTQTPMTESSQRDPANTKMLQDFAASIPAGGKAAQPEEIAYAINFLLSPRASFVYGVLVFVDGGQDTVLRPNLEAF